MLLLFLINLGLLILRFVFVFCCVFFNKINKKILFNRTLIILLRMALSIGITFMEPPKQVSERREGKGGRQKSSFPRFLKIILLLPPPPLPFLLYLQEMFFLLKLLLKRLREVDCWLPLITQACAFFLPNGGKDDCYFPPPGMFFKLFS